MAQCRKLPEMEFSGNIAEKWKKWKQKYELFMRASKGYKEDEEDQIAILLNAIGDDGLTIYNTFDLDEGNKKKIDKVLDAFNQYCAPRKNLVYEQSVFFTCSQEENETIDHFLTRLKSLASSCEFDSQLKQMITLRLVLGINDKVLKERLLRVPDLTLEKAADYCRACEASKIQLHAMEESVMKIEAVEIVAPSQAAVEELKSVPQPNLKKDWWRKEAGPKTYTDWRRKEVDFPKVGTTCEDEFNCKKCGYRHKPRQCPAFNKSCAKCKGPNHFAKMCQQKRVRECRLEDSSSEEDEHNRDQYVTSVSIKSPDLRVCSVEKGTKCQSQWLETIDVEGQSVQCKIDTGAEVSIFPLKLFVNIQANAKLTPTKAVLVAFGNSKIIPKGKVVLNCNRNDKEGPPVKIEFMVTDVKCMPMLGLGDSQKLGFVPLKLPVSEITQLRKGSKSDVLQTYKDVFTGLGCMPGTHKIVLNPDHTPVIHPSRRIPLSLQDKLKSTIENLVDQGIVEKVVKPTDWSSNLVIVEKSNGSLRLCLDPKDLNVAIKRQHYPIPTAEEVMANLSDMKHFSIVDMKEGFWQVRLDEASSDLCTFNTPMGRHRFRRLPYGIKSAPEVFQQLNSENFSDIPGVQIIFDDIIVAGKTELEHDRALVAVLERARERNIKFNPDKFQYNIKEVRYMGHVLSGKGVHPDDQRIKAIVAMPAPTSVKEVRRFMGMVNYVGKFIPRLSAISEPLRNLLKADSDWQWEHEQQKSFQEIKDRLCSAPVLAFFDSKEETVLQVDASKGGLGACLMQAGRPIAYASRSLTDTERDSYAQIEKELLAIVFGVEKFHYYVYGRKTVIQSDHKPLLSIMTKYVNKVSSRLQRMQLKLMKYDLQIVHVPGSKMYMADTLSRAYLPETGDVDPDLEVTVHLISKYLPMSESLRVDLQSATRTDEAAQALISLHEKGWPKYVNKVPKCASYYWKHQQDISVSDGLVFINDRLLVPMSLRVPMLELVHEGHWGEDKTKNRARQVLFWPRMTSEIEQYVKQCKTCEKFRKRNAKEPLMPHPIPDRPWETLAADIMEYKGVDFLVIKDYYSKWVELIQISRKTAGELITKFKSVFSKFGIPDKLVSDNMPFSSLEFRKFAKEWGFQTVTSSPRFPQSNGMAENGVKLAKTMLKKAYHHQADIYILLLEYRNTPVTGLDLSPSQLLQSRRLKSKIPTTAPLLLPQLCSDVKEKLEYLQGRQKEYFDRNTKALPPLTIGDPVVMQQGNSWVPATVKEKSSTPRSFFVTTGDGSTLRRNRRDLCKSVHSPVPVCEPDWRELLPEEIGNEEQEVERIVDEPGGMREAERIVDEPGESDRRSSRIRRQPERFRDFVLS